MLLMAQSEFESNFFFLQVFIPPPPFLVPPPPNHPTKQPSIQGGDTGQGESDNKGGWNDDPPSHLKVPSEVWNRWWVFSLNHPLGRGGGQKIKSWYWFYLCVFYPSLYSTDTQNLEIGPP